MSERLQTIPEQIYARYQNGIEVATGSTRKQNGWIDAYDPSGKMVRASNPEYGGHVEPMGPGGERWKVAQLEQREGQELLEGLLRVGNDIELFIEFELPDDKELPAFLDVEHVTRENGVVRGEMFKLSRRISLDEDGVDNPELFKKVHDDVVTWLGDHPFTAYWNVNAAARGANDYQGGYGTLQVSSHFEQGLGQQIIEDAFSNPARLLSDSSMVGLQSRADYFQIRAVDDGKIDTSQEPVQIDHEFSRDLIVGGLLTPALLYQLTQVCEGQTGPDVEKTWQEVVFNLEFIQELMAMKETLHFVVTDNRAQLMVGDKNADEFVVSGPVHKAENSRVEPVDAFMDQLYRVMENNQVDLVTIDLGEYEEESVSEQFVAPFVSALRGIADNGSNTTVVTVSRDQLKRLLSSAA